MVVITSSSHSWPSVTSHGAREVVVIGGVVGVVVVIGGVVGVVVVIVVGGLVVLGGSVGLVVLGGSVVVGVVLNGIVVDGGIVVDSVVVDAWHWERGGRGGPLIQPGQASVETQEERRKHCDPMWEKKLHSVLFLQAA